MLYKKTEAVGFEPTVRVNVHTLSKRAPSATRTPLLKDVIILSLPLTFLQAWSEDGLCFYLNLPL